MFSLIGDGALDDGLVMESIVRSRAVHYGSEMWKHGVVEVTRHRHVGV